MNLARILASALARRLAYLLVAAALTWMGVGDAKAQWVSTKCSAFFGANACDQAAAHSACLEQHDTYLSEFPNMRPGGCTHSAYEQGYACGVYTQNGTPGSCPRTWFRYDVARSCSGRPNYVGPPPVSTGQYRPRSGSLSCISGCEAAMFNNGDGTWTGYYSASGNACTNGTLQEACETMAGMHWNAYNLTCEPNQSECPENFIQDAATGTCKETCPDGMVVNQDNQCETPPDNCPPGNVKSPEGGCLPGEGQCAEGEARRENGTCGRDADGDGQADEDDDNPDNDPDKPSFSGGDNCDTPPSCSGDPIMCGQARIQWRIDCNTRKDRKISGGSCAAIPICTGKNCDAMEYSQLLMQWRATCALEKLNTGGGGPGGGTDVSDISEALTGSSQGNPGEAGNPSDAWVDGEGEGEGYEPDASGYGWASSCPANPTVTVFDRTIEFNLSPFCQWITLGGYIAMALTALGCIRIVAGRAS